MAQANWTIKVDNSEIPQPELADSKELNNLVQRGVMPNPRPIEPIGDRYNPNMAYNQSGVLLSPQDAELVCIVDVAIKNGWNWRETVHDSITKGTEAEAVVKALKKAKANVRDLLLNVTFAKALFGQNYKEALQSMVIEEDILKYVRNKLNV